MMMDINADDKQKSKCLLKGQKGKEGKQSFGGVVAWSWLLEK
jgi:hypothetical protein